MEPVIAISYILFFITIPIGLLLISIKAYGDGRTPLIVIGKLLFGFVIYFVVSVVTVGVVFSIIFNINRQSDTIEIELAAQTLCLLIIAAYGFVGWLLCSFIYGKPVKSISDFRLFAGKISPIFLR